MVAVVCLAAVIVWGVLQPATARGEGDRPPNIVLVLADDMGYGDLGSYGGKLAPTPNLDRMAAEGVRFTRYYAASPICSPSRTGLTTGMYPGRWRITSYLQTRAGNHGCGQADYLDPRAPSLARVLKSAGYATMHVGKWHLGGGRDVTDAPPFAAYGFDEHVGTYESPEPAADIAHPAWTPKEGEKVVRHRRTEYFVDRALDFLRRHADRPCYVNLWTDDTHTPFSPSQERLTEYPSGPDQERRFRAVLDEFDRQMGRLFAGLGDLGLDGRTLVIFTGDNGALPTFGGRRSGGLRGSKLSLYEGGMREPFIVRWPGRVPAGRVDDRTVISAVDLLPSLCAIAGVFTPIDPPLDGEDLSGALLGTPADRKGPIFWEYGRNDEFFAYPRAPDRSPNVAVRDGKWKLLVNVDGSGVELYDLAADPAESVNLADKQPDVAKRLAQMALAWRRTLP